MYTKFTLDCKPTRFLVVALLFSILNSATARSLHGRKYDTNDPDDCASAVDISAFFNAGTGIIQTTGSYDNTAATADPGDPVPSCFAETGQNPIINNSLWFKFTGNGGLFHLETVPCNTGSAYITGGDTQMSIFQGTSCDNLMPIACNEDLYPDNDPNTDFRAGLDIQTADGQTYYILIDGYASGETVARGFFCIEITRMMAISCDQAVCGTFQIANNGFLCKGQNLLNALTFNAETFVIPSGVPLAGMIWVLTAQPIPANTWPGTIPGVISTPLSAYVTQVNLLNNITSSEPLIFYFSPVVVGGASLINPLADAKVTNLDVSAGCFAVGAPQILTLVPTLEPLEGIATVSSATSGQNNGSVYLTLHGGYPSAISDPSLYQILWNTGATTQNLYNIGPGTYTVTVTDPSGCTNSLTLSADVIVSAHSPVSILQLDVNPIPTTGILHLNVVMRTAAPVQIDVLNPFGQSLYHVETGSVRHLEQDIDLHSYPNGVYFLCITGHADRVVRRIVVQH